MSTLYLDHANTELRRDGDALALLQDGSLVRRVPLRLLTSVVVRGDALLHASALTAMALHSCTLVVLPRYRSYGEAVLTRANGPDAVRRLLQYRCASDSAFRSRVAGLLIRAKLHGHARLLYRHSLCRPDLSKPLGDAISRLAAAQRQIRLSPELALPRLLGLEGAAAAAYFSAYQLLFPSALDFNGRNRRPPRDPVNACLSLAYTLLHAECISSILGAGLDPSLGFFHEPLHGRESLACDLVEFLRPAADAWVFSLFHERKLQEANFKTVQNACLLGKAGRRTFYEAFEPLRAIVQRRLRHALRALIQEMNHANGNGPATPAHALLESDA